MGNQSAFADVLSLSGGDGSVWWEGGGGFGVGRGRGGVEGSERGDRRGLYTLLITLAARFEVLVFACQKWRSKLTPKNTCMGKWG